MTTWEARRLANDERGMADDPETPYGKLFKEGRLACLWKNEKTSARGLGIFVVDPGFSPKKGDIVAIKGDGPMTVIGRSIEKMPEKKMPDVYLSPTVTNLDMANGLGHDQAKAMGIPLDGQPFIPPADKTNRVPPKHNPNGFDIKAMEALLAEAKRPSLAMHSGIDEHGRKVLSVIVDPKGDFEKPTDIIASIDLKKAVEFVQNDPNGGSKLQRALWFAARDIEMYAVTTPPSQPGAVADESRDFGRGYP
jgi:hypothetical protein